jgi:hypothetical protein
MGDFGARDTEMPNMHKALSLIPNTANNFIHIEIKDLGLGHGSSPNTTM